MKIVSFLAAAFLITFLTPSCKKEDGASAEDLATAEEFKEFVVTKNFQIEDYYSDKPIDYETDDAEIKAETELWQYVSSWIQDDFNVFNVATGKVTITQNARKLDGLADEVLTRDFSIGADKDGPYFKFLNYQYNPLTYRLVEFTGNHFVVYVDWKDGAKVYTRFEALPE